MRALPILLLIALADQPPTSRESCEGDEFANGPGPYELATPKPGTKPSLPLEEKTTWIAGNRKGDWVCVSDGKNFGWTKRDELDLTPAPNRSIKDWLGTWKRDSGQATVRIRKKEDGLEVTG